MYQTAALRHQKLRSSSRPENSPNETRRLLAGCHSATNIYGVPLPFTMIYLLLFPYPSKTTFWVCSGILLFFVLLGYSGWTVRTLCRRLYSLVQGKQASGPSLVVPASHRITP